MTALREKVCAKPQPATLRAVDHGRVGIFARDPPRGHIDRDFTEGLHFGRGPRLNPMIMTRSVEQTLRGQCLATLSLLKRVQFRVFKTVDSMIFTSSFIKEDYFLIKLSVKASVWRWCVGWMNPLTSWRSLFTHARSAEASENFPRLAWRKIPKKASHPSGGRV